jgi:hypothetical protein
MFSSFLFLVIDIQRIVTTFYMQSLSKCTMTKIFIIISHTFIKNPQKKSYIHVIDMDEFPKFCNILL